MRVVLDTQAVIWLSLSPAKLSIKAMSALKKSEDEGYLISQITYWEISMLIRYGRLDVPVSYNELIETILQAYPITEISITPEIAHVSTGLRPPISKDPADRIIAATSLVYNTPLITKDGLLRKSMEIETIW